MYERIFKPQIANENLSSVNDFVPWWEESTTNSSAIQQSDDKEKQDLTEEEKKELKKTYNELSKEYYTFLSKHDNVGAAKVAMKAYYKLVEAAEKYGYTHAAENLKHYLDGSGEKKMIKYDWLKNYPHVIEGVKKNLNRFKIDENSKSGQNSFEDWAEQLKEGETKRFYDEWETLISDNRDSEFKTDISFALGSFSLVSRGNFSITKNGEKYLVSGKVTHHIEDKYDWHEGLSVDIFGFTFDDEVAEKAKFAGASEYLIESESWETQVKSGSYFTFQPGTIWDTLDTNNINFES